MILDRLFFILWALSGAILIAIASILPAAAGEILQYFPVAKPGQPTPKPESGWRIQYSVIPPSNGYGRASILEFGSISFMRGYKPDGSEDWIKILNNLALSEIYVPYNRNAEIFDITNYPFRFIEASASYVPDYGIIRGEVQPDRIVVSEITDENVRWMDTQNKMRRGQAITLWATLNAQNYRYILSYGFADDGTIRVRTGGTASNLRSVEPGNPAGIHIHMPAWRMEFDLGDAAENDVMVMERNSHTNDTTADLTHQPFNNGLEGGINWNPERFTTLMITNRKTLNWHEPPLNTSYKFMLMRSGSTRTSRDFTKYDFWVTKRFPDSPQRQARLPELTFIDVPKNVSTPEVFGGPLVVWHQASLHHTPRSEDFGTNHWNAREGLAINMWAGFDLMPMNLWSKTPLTSR